MTKEERYTSISRCRNINNIRIDIFTNNKAKSEYDVIDFNTRYELNENKKGIIYNIECKKTKTIYIGMTLQKEETISFKGHENDKIVW